MTGPTVTIRDATLDDVAPIVALIESAYRGDSSRTGWTTEADLLDGRRTDEDDVTRVLTTPDSRMLLAVSGDGAIIGCANLQRRDEVTAYFGMFAVSPGLQGGGVGRLLLDAAESDARTDWAATRMEMTVLGQRSDLIAWYVRRGYQPTGKTEPWPHTSETFGLPRRDDLYFATLAKDLTGP